MNRYNVFGTPLDVYVAAAIMAAVLLVIAAYGYAEAKVFRRRIEEEKNASDEQ